MTTDIFSLTVDMVSIAAVDFINDTKYASEESYYGQACSLLKCEVVTKLSGNYYEVPEYVEVAFKTWYHTNSSLTFGDFMVRCFTQSGDDH